MTTPLEMRAAPLDQGDLDMLQISIQQTPTDELMKERAELRAKITGGYVGVREPGSGTHPVIATLQLIDQELNRRGGYWADAAGTRVIGRADVPLDGPQTFDLIKRRPPAPDTTTYVEKAALTEEQVTDFVRQLAKTTNADLQEMYAHLVKMVGTMEGYVRRAAGVHPDLEKLELVEQAKLDREMDDWGNKTILRGALIGAVAGTGLGYVSERSIPASAIVCGLASAVAARYSWWYRKLIGAAPPPDAKEQSPEEKAKINGELGAFDFEPYRLGVVGEPHWIGEPRINPDLYWRR